MLKSSNTVFQKKKHQTLRATGKQRETMRDITAVYINVEQCAHYRIFGYYKTQLIFLRDNVI